MSVPGAFPDADEANEFMNESTENGRNAPGLVNRFDDEGDDDEMMDGGEEDDPVRFPHSDRAETLADYSFSYSTTTTARSHSESPRMRTTTAQAVEEASSGSLSIPPTTKSCSSPRTAPLND